MASDGALSSPSAWRRAGLVALVVVILDQWSKQLLRSSLAPGGQTQLLPGLKLIRTANTGAAFSLFTGSAGAVTILAVIVLVVLVAFFARNPSHALLWLPCGMIVGGALGNLIDRVRLGAVTDFIKLPDWPAFNLADSAITVGVIALVLILGRSGASSPG
ncbi:MAG: signal peptidase II [Solirubrobacteraceae bacterium]